MSNIKPDYNTSGPGMAAHPTAGGYTHALGHDEHALGPCAAFRACPGDVYASSA